MPSGSHTLRDVSGRARVRGGGSSCEDLQSVRLNILLRPPPPFSFRVLCWTCARPPAGFCHVLCGQLLDIVVVHVRKQDEEPKQEWAIDQAVPSSLCSEAVGVVWCPLV